MAAILIIEDDVHINNLLKEALEQEGYQCIQAFSGSEGNLVLEKGGFDLVLLDLMLPGMPGEKVLLEIRQKGQIPVIVLTAKEELDSKVDMLLAGADDYILKPFEIREVLARIQVQLRKSGNVGQKTVLEHKGLRLDKEEHPYRDHKAGISDSGAFSYMAQESIWQRRNLRGGLAGTFYGRDEGDRCPHKQYTKKAPGSLRCKLYRDRLGDRL